MMRWIVAGINFKVFFVAEQDLCVFAAFFCLTSGVIPQVWAVSSMCEHTARSCTDSAGEP